MIVSAAIKIYDYKQNKEVIIPCHRHCDAFRILRDFNYRKIYDYKEIGQGFLTEAEEFLDRVSAFKHAQACNQISPLLEITELFSEDLW